MNAERVAALLALVCTLAGCLACSGENAKTTAAQAERAPGYPRARWRLANPEDLDKTVLWVSHIVILHRDSVPEECKLRAYWHPEGKQTRSPTEAYALARQVRAYVAADATRFADLARKYSDDLATKSEGGSLGGVRATQLPPEFLDALSSMRPGDVSDVVETRMGFHVLLKRYPPPYDQANAARLVVRYRTTFGETESSRTRDEALSLAEQVVRRTRGGESFATLASDAGDLFRGEDWGTWNSLDPGSTPTVIEALMHLHEGQISDPIDTRLGVQVVQRLPVVARPEVAMRAVKLVVDPRAPESDQNSEKGTRDEATRVAAASRDNPDAFDEYARKYCCIEPERWEVGHGDSALTEVLQQLPFGAITETPIRIPFYYVVAQRVDPRVLGPQSRLSYELPQPALVRTEEIIRDSQSRTLAKRLGEVQRFLGRMDLSPSERKAVTATIQQFGADLAALSSQDSESARVAAYRAAQRRLYAQVSEVTYAHITSAIELWLLPQVLRRVN